MTDMRTETITVNLPWEDDPETTISEMIANQIDETGPTGSVNPRLEADLLTDKCGQRSNPRAVLAYLEENGYQAAVERAANRSHQQYPTPQTHLYYLFLGMAETALEEHQSDS